MLMDIRKISRCWRGAPRGAVLPLSPRDLMMMTVSVLLMAGCSFCIVSAAAPDSDAGTYTVGDFVYEKHSTKDFAYIINYVGSGGAVEIPAKVTLSGTECTVLGIDDGAFNECRTVTSVIIPEGITFIGTEAFSGCNNLTKVIFPQTLINIGEMAFFGCSSLKSVTIPSSVTDIGTSAFWCCKSLEEVVYLGSADIPANAFRQCTSLSSVEISGNVGSILIYAFYCCTSLESIDFPDSLKSIDMRAFYGCGSLKSIGFGTGIESVSPLSFGMEDAVRPDGVPTKFCKEDGKTEIDLGSGAGELRGRDFEGSISKMTKVSEYTVTFYDQITYTDVRYNVGDRIAKPADPQMTGYTFQYWMDEKGNEFDFTDAAMPARDVLLTAYWKVNRLTVTYDTGTGTTFTDTCGYGGTIELRDGSDISNPGHTFKGWMTDGDVEIHAAGDEYIVTSDITFTAVWDTEFYTVTYITGAGGDITNRYAYNTAMTLLDGSSIPNPGHRLTGWTSGGTAYSPGAEYTVTADVSFTAVWEDICTVTFIAGAGADISQTFSPGNVITLPDGRDGSISKAGSILVGWKMDDDTGAYGLGTAYEVMSDAVFRAVWTDDSDAIVYLTDGGALVGDMYERSEDGIARIDAAVEKDGYAFLGWRFTDDENGIVYAPGLYVEVSGSMHMEPCLVADGTQLRTISYDYSGGAGEVVSQKAVAGMRISLPAERDVVREGHTFIGWEASGRALAGGMYTLGGTAVTDGWYTVTSEDVVLTAVWRSDSPEPEWWDDEDDGYCPIIAPDASTSGGSDDKTIVIIAAAVVAAALQALLLADLKRR